MSVEAVILTVFGAYAALVVGALTAGVYRYLCGKAHECGARGDHLLHIIAVSGTVEDE